MLSERCNEMQSMRPGFQTSFTVDKINLRFFASLRMTMLVALTLQPFNPSRVTSTWPSAPGTGIPRNQNCPAWKNLRRFGANPVDARQCSEIFSGADHFQRDVWQQFRVAGWITAPGAFRIRSKERCSAKPKLQGRAPPKMEKARWPGCPRHASRQLTPSLSMTLQTQACSGNSRTDVRVIERNRLPRRRCFCRMPAEDAPIRAPRRPARRDAVADGLMDACR